MKSCFFIGHREASEGIYPALADAVEQHIVDYGVTEFIVGNYGNFDRMAARAVISAKALHPGVTLLLLIPYYPTERPVETPPGFDGTFYPPGMEALPRRYAIARSNRYMVQHVNHLIAYAWRPASNARDILEYAQRRGIPMPKKAAAAVAQTIAHAGEATPKAPAGKNVPGKGGKGMGVKGAAKAAGTSLGTKIAAGVAAVAMTVSIPVTVVRVNRRDASPDTDQPMVQEIQQTQTDAAGATKAAMDREETQTMIAQDPRDAYESLLRAGVTQDGLPMEYYAILDLGGTALRS